MTIQIYELCGADQNILFSPHCWKARLSLAHKGLDYQTIPTPFTKVATTEGGDSRRVPVIRDEETVVEESYEIAKYLERTYPDAPSLFKGDGAQALTQFVINWSNTQVHPAVVKLCLLDIHNALADEDKAFFRRTREGLFGCTLEEFDAKFPKNSDGLAAALKPLEMTLKNQPYLGGDTPIFADYVLFGPLQWMRVTDTRGLMLKEGPVADWFNSLLDMYDGLGRSVPAAA